MIRGRLKGDIKAKLRAWRGASGLESSLGRNRLALEDHEVCVLSDIPDEEPEQRRLISAAEFGAVHLDADEATVRSEAQREPVLGGDLLADLAGRCGQLLARGGTQIEVREVRALDQRPYQLIAQGRLGEVRRDLLGELDALVLGQVKLQAPPALLARFHRRGDGYRLVRGELLLRRLGAIGTEQLRRGWLAVEDQRQLAQVSGHEKVQRAGVVNDVELTRLADVDGPGGALDIHAEGVHPWVAVEDVEAVNFGSERQRLSLTGLQAALSGGLAGGRVDAVGQGIKVSEAGADGGDVQRYLLAGLGLDEQDVALAEVRRLVLGDGGGRGERHGE